ncbi:MAG: phosphate acyltransferase PlsX, partial [Chloroflexi bacterium]|nr:phosphate acyltransferase PlsX [Chloroflexota bacterium]
AHDLDVEIILIGPQDQIEAELARQTGSQPAPPNVRLVHAPQVIGMDEHPVAALRSKRDSSIVRGLGLVERGEGDAFVTAGSTGATMAGAVMELKRIPGIDRPALATPFPTRHGPCLLLDVGAGVEAKAQNLVQFAIMGAIYAEQVLGVREPRVGLLNIGEEASKGPPFYQEANQLLQNAPIRFVGNIEGRDVPTGAADVVIMDGFLGNVMIKLAEGIAASILDILRSEIRSNPLTGLIGLGLMPVFGRVRRRLDYAEYGGAPLLGVNGVCIVAHGRSNPLAIRSAIRVAADAVNSRMLERIRSGLGETATWGGASSQ